MAEKLNPKRTAVALGTAASLAHLVWAALVAAGLGQWLVDFKLGLHFMRVPATVAAFDPVTAAELVVLSFAGGAAVGWVFAWIWNWSGKWK
ncbi:MAG: hypothetical protein HYW26_01235 [Candidatus Aenigmarchaeota archaeon]|nr:hypothetical protein [Candidatus Aenigmarchaeota archaeon]